MANKYELIMTVASDDLDKDSEQFSAEVEITTKTADPIQDISLLEVGVLNFFENFFKFFDIEDRKMLLNTFFDSISNKLNAMVEELPTDVDEAFIENNLFKIQNLAAMQNSEITAQLVSQKQKTSDKRDIEQTAQALVMEAMANLKHDD